ncbi:TPA: hypothetical protein N0F65_011215 [Lagenidium giganteum]|uniref:Uncharacterized protein n=1 Tax=Lagenidium giganteum TaxID=4803 RepID=A0AAV2YT51_9STRA|nr:TPA: hypothetical protein N0F65_011215 [Lagenidium giganteum]
MASTQDIAVLGDDSNGHYARLATPTHIISQSYASTNHSKKGSTLNAESTDPKAPQSVSFSELFQFADSRDRVLIAIGCIAAAVTGMLEPMLIVLMGDVINSFNPRKVITMDQLVHNVNHVALNFVFVACGLLVTGWIQVACWTVAASRQAKRIRNAYVRAILIKEIGWFDVNDSMQLATKVSDSALSIQEGLGRKVGDGIGAFANGITGCIIGLFKGWELTLVLMACVPLISLSGVILMKAVASATQAGITSYAQAGAVAQEAISNVRTVQMFNSIPHFISKCYDGGKVFTIFFCVLFGAIHLAQCAPSLEAVATARAAAYDVFAMIHGGSLIDPLSERGAKLDQVHGKIEIRDAGETVALVGPSGSGKSTIVSLLKRFNDPSSGSVKLDGTNIRDLNVKWLRQQIGLVGQEPVLFATSILENIRNGRPSATDDEVLDAAKMANAYNFIMEFPEGFDTQMFQSHDHVRSLSVISHGAKTCETKVMSEEHIETKNVSMARLWKLTFEDWKHLALGVVGTVLNAAVYPVWGVLLGKIITLLLDYSKTKSEMREEAGYRSIAFFGMGILALVTSVVQKYGFGVVSHRLVAKMRLKTLESVLRQDIGWFDLPENSSGSLISRLTADSAALHAVTAGTLNQMLTYLSTIGVGYILGFAYSWEFALVLLAILPLMLFPAFATAQQLSGTSNNKSANDADQMASSLLAEAITSMRTVASYGMERSLNSKYCSLADASKRTDVKVGLVNGLWFGMSQCVKFLNMALLFWIGGQLVKNRTIKFKDMFIVHMAIMMSSLGAGVASQSMPNVAKGKEAAARVFEIIERVITSMRRQLVVK